MNYNSNSSESEYRYKISWSCWFPLFIDKIKYFFQDIFDKNIKDDKKKYSQIKKNYFKDYYENYDKNITYSDNNFKIKDILEQFKDYVIENKGDIDEYYNKHNAIPLRNKTPTILYFFKKDDDGSLSVQYHITSEDIIKNKDILIEFLNKCKKETNKEQHIFIQNLKNSENFTTLQTNLKHHLKFFKIIASIKYIKRNFLNSNDISKNDISKIVTIVKNIESDIQTLRLNKKYYTRKNEKYTQIIKDIKNFYENKNK